MISDFRQLPTSESRPKGKLMNKDFSIHLQINLHPANSFNHRKLEKGNFETIGGSHRRSFKSKAR